MVNPMTAGWAKAEAIGLTEAGECFMLKTASRIRRHVRTPGNTQ
jgi:hypothetical protein